MPFFLINFVANILIRTFKAVKIVFFPDNNKFPKLNFPAYPLKIKQSAEKAMIWDRARQIWLMLTPEEWVRQHTLHFLIDYLGITPALITLEHPVEVGTGTNQRIDILTYDKNAKAQLLVECKASSVQITKNTLAQAVRYNSCVKAKYIMLTNGLSHYVYLRETTGEYTSVSSLEKLLKLTL